MTFDVFIDKAPSWIIAGVAIFGAWKSWIASMDIKQVKHATDGLLEKAESAAKAKGNLAGRKELKSEQSRGKKPK